MEIDHHQISATWNRALVFFSRTSPLQQFGIGFSVGWWVLMALPHGSIVPKYILFVSRPSFSPTLSLSPPYSLSPFPPSHTCAGFQATSSKRSAEWQPFFLESRSSQCRLDWANQFTPAHTAYNSDCLALCPGGVCSGHHQDKLAPAAAAGEEQN